MDPNDIEKSHPMSASGRFSDAKHGTVADLADRLKQDPKLAASIPPIEVAKLKGTLYSENNKRLTAFKMAGVPVPTTPASKKATEVIRHGVQKKRR